MAFTHHGDLPYLPQELFQMIVHDIEPVDFVRCRRVNSAWYRAFTSPISLAYILKSSYPLAKEVRELFQTGTPNALQTIHDLSQGKQRVLFDRVVQRYYRLARGMPRSVHKFYLQQAETAEYGRRFCAVPPWDSHASHPGGKIDMLFDHAFWTYEDGLVVFPDEHERSLVLLDLETQLTFMVPFVSANKIIRRIRLQDKLLVIEWAEDEPIDSLGLPSLHRYYATSFEINRAGRGWDVILRNEWKIIPYGHSLGHGHWFHSTHSRIHYAIYSYGLPRHSRGEVNALGDVPLTIWDISEFSEYRVSQDSMSQSQDASRDSGPFIVAEFKPQQLEPEPPLSPFGLSRIRRGWATNIMRMDIDSSAYTISITEIEDVGRRMDYNPLEYAPVVNVISIPFARSGDPYRRQVQTCYPPYRGNCSMEISPWTATSPWPCYWAICESTDEKARVSFCLSYLSSRTQTGYEEDPLMVTIQTSQSITTLSHDFAEEVSFKGKICGDERFLVGENAQNQLVVLYF
jgi:hypothetical protein